MSKPAWLESQLADRARTEDALGAAADQSNTCRAIAAELHKQGRDHFTDPTWRAEIAKLHPLVDAAGAHGLDAQDIGDEADRRRTS